MSKTAPIATAGDVAAWFKGWFVPDENDAWCFAKMVRHAQSDNLLTNRLRDDDLDKHEPWEIAADMLIRDLPAVVKQSLEIDGGGEDSYTQALAALFIAAQNVREIEFVPSTSRGTTWHHYALKFFDEANRMASAAGLLASGLRSTSHGIIVTQKALEAAGLNYDNDTISKTLQRMRRPNTNARRGTKRS